MDAPGYNAGRRRVTADPPIAPGRACYKPRRVRAGSSPLVIAHMAVESARLVAGNEVTAAMPAAGFRERAGYHRTRTTRCPSMGCCPCSGLDPPSRCKNVSCLCFGLGLAAGAGEVQRAARRPARNQYTQQTRCRASRRNRAAAPPACNPAAATRWTPGEGRGRRKRAPPAKLAPTSLGALRPLTTHAAPPGLRQAAQIH